MDNLTHSLFALTLARTPLARAGRGSTAVLLVASNAPDLDFLASLGRGIEYLQWHRGPTHGLLGIVGLGAASAAVVWLVQRARSGRGDPPGSFSNLLGLGILGVLGHILMDLPTSYGTRILSPFDWGWFSTDWMPIVDIYLWAILGAGLVFGQMSSDRRIRTRNAMFALVLMLGDYTVRALSHREALQSASRAFGPLLPPRCDGWSGPGWMLARWPPDRSTVAPSPGAVCLNDLAAIPTFISPFRWRLIASTPHGYHLRDLDLLSDRTERGQRRGQQDPAYHRSVESHWRLAVSYPNRWTPEVFRAADTEIGRQFLGFARFAAVRSVTGPDGHVMVQWTDLRFLNNDVRRPGPRGTRERGLFTATVRLDRDGRALHERLGP
jgi:inner membrane protein